MQGVVNHAVYDGREDAQAAQLWFGATPFEELRSRERLLKVSARLETHPRDGQPRETLSAEHHQHKTRQQHGVGLQIGAARLPRECFRAR